jgi:hypothetical protein
VEAGVVTYSYLLPAFASRQVRQLAVPEAGSW